MNKPIFTEKSFLYASQGAYTFAVDKSMTKSSIKAQVESIFKVNVVKVTSLVQKGKTTHQGRRRQIGVKPPVKAVRLWLKKGQSIDLFDIKKD